MKMNISDQRYFRHAFTNLFQGNRRVVVRNRQPHNLATGADHLFDLLDSFADIRGVSLGHRLNRHGRTAAYLNMFDLYRSGFTDMANSFRFRVLSPYLQL